MLLIRFNSDYCEGAHPDILDALIRTNLEQTPGYGEDGYCHKAAELILKKCGSLNADVHFLVGGTQTNLILISAALRPHQGVLCASSGHISVHEAGAIEATGHKIITIPASDGKLTAEDVRIAALEYSNDHTREHMVQPKLVYISNPTEFGTVYSKSELSALSTVCNCHGLYLYMDGARLGYGLCCTGNDLDLAEIASLCDAFYIGGTKVGLLFGEALVVVNHALKPDLRSIIKQNGGMLAKGRLLGVQFKAAFENNLYFDMSTHAIRLADIIRDALVKKKVRFLVDSPTNQLFPILSYGDIDRLSQSYILELWQRIDESNAAVRICTSWATDESHAARLASDILAL